MKAAITRGGAARGGRSVVPRHNEIGSGVAVAICKQRRTQAAQPALNLRVRVTSVCHKRIGERRITIRCPTRRGILQRS